MSRIVELFATGKLLGKATLPSNYPADPPVVIWKGRVFHGGLSYGAADQYHEIRHFNLRDDEVSHNALP